MMNVRITGLAYLDKRTEVQSRLNGEMNKLLEKKQEFPPFGRTEGRLLKVAFHTLGCKLNYAESSSLERKFKEQGFEVVDFKEKADVYVINTCTVTSLAEKKCRNSIRQAAINNPEAKIAVIGCFSQLRPEEIRQIEGVDYVLGNADKHKLLDYLLQDENRSYVPCVQMDVLPIDDVKEFIPSYSVGNRTRSFLKIQDGCDYFCTYCAIPFARGRNRSQNIEFTVEKAKEVAALGVKEVVLTGVNIGEFGTQHQESFFQLIQQLDKIEGIERYRISSIEPNLLSDEMLDFVAKSRSFLPHFHIPLQSGNNKILALMKRRYTRELFTSRIKKIKELMPDACIAADVIVGFPGETDEDFRDTYSYIQSLPVSYLHVFTYSERPDSYALKLPDKAPMDIRRERSRILQQLSDQKKNAFYKENEQTLHSVLWESDNEKGIMSGFTENYIRVCTPFKNELVNTITKVRLTKLTKENEYECLFI